MRRRRLGHPNWLQKALKELLNKDHLGDQDIIDLAGLFRQEAIGGVRDFVLRSA